MRTNVLNDLSNVVKKGTSSACSWSQVGRMSEGAPDEHPMSIRSASDEERWKPAGEKGSTRVWKHVAMIFAVLVMSIANIGMAWGAYTPTADEVIVLNTVYNSSATGSGYSNHSAIAWGGTGSTNSMKAGDPSNNGAATSENVTCYSVKGNGKGKNITISITGCSKIIVYHQSHSSRYVRLHENDKDGTVIGSGAANTYYTEVNLTPATTYTIFLEGWTGSAQTDFYVYAVKLIKASSCAAADLAAANITSNGDQIVGTGITFSKVGSPASGDTWYWQTSATGTDKTRNASSPHTTATTAGSYTVYLRAYNTAADCWGKAIGKTNTIISCPLDVYNGENVDKGNATASGWTINSSTNMAKTSGSSNGYSYWYQAGSSSSYVQFDGSIALASGDQIKIQWTHTASSNKTLALTINGSSVSLASGSTAKNSVLTEAIYNVTSATNVTSIKLNSSGSSGCIIYQVSIVKAACDDEPSCSAPTSPSISGTTAYTEGQTINLTASATGTDGSTTYTWYKGADWATASAGSSIGSAATFTKASCAVGDAGTYWCNISNGTGCEVQVSKTITVAEASCDAADLTASNITSNGDQDAGTGITFSKVGSPASGDTWYWQTSATGTDKTYNASSPYTTATTVGSYTVYLRAYNTAGNCWGEAASKTNTIYPAPSAMIHNTFVVNDAWSSTIATQDKTNITSLNAMAAVGESVGSGSNKDGLTQKIPSQSSEDASKYMSLSFNVASGKQLNVTSVVFDEQPVTGTGTFKVSISDNQGSTTKTQTIASDAAGSKHTLTLDGDIVGSFKGTVTVKVWAYGWGEGYRFGDYFYINGTVTDAAPSCTAPTSPSITPSNGWLYVPGEEITLTASASNTDASTTYTWYRGATLEAAKAAGAIQAAKTSAQGGTTYTIASCTASDAYRYWCEISNGTGCEASASYDIKLYTFFLYNNDNSNNSSHAFTSIDRTYKKLSVTFDVSNATYTYYFKVSDGLGTWYGKNSSTITSATNYCDGLNSSGANVGLTTTLAGSYTVDYYYESNNVVVTYPVPNQTADQTVYFDNTLAQMSNMYIRIGSTTYSNASSAFTAVPGTAALYQGSTIAWDGFAAWSIADNTGWTGENSIYQPWNGQWTGTGNNYQMSKQTDYQNYAVSGAVTIVPTALHNSEYNCQYYNVDKYNGLLRDRVTITAPVNGTITVNYTSEEGVASSFSATTVDMNQDLAHTVIITPTATPAEGYTLSGLTVNGAAHTSGNTYTVTANTTIAATFSPASYTVTLNTNGGTINAGNVTSYTYGTGATLPTNVTKSGFTFGGWYDNSGLTGSAVTTISTTATGNKEYWAKWTAAASLTALECNTRYTVQDMTAGGCGTLSTTSCYSAGLSANNRFEVLGDPSKTDQAGGTPEQKTNSKQTINSIDFTSFMYLKGDGLNGSTEPTCRGVKFIIPSAGKLTIYYRYGDRSKLKKEGEDAVNVGATTGGYGYDTHDVTAGTYYIYGVSSGAVLIAVEYQCCTTPAAPTVFSAGSITSTGATFSITDAANAASYDIYYSTSSTAPTAVTAATTTSTEKTKTVTGLTASTTYYAWVRSVCDADHKSAWVALSGSSFETSAAAATPILSWALATNSASWTATPTNNDETNLTDVATSTEHAAIQSGATSGKTCKISLSSSATPDKYVTFTFKVACGKKLTPSSVWMEVANVGGSSDGKMTHKAELSDIYGHTISATVVPASDGVLNELNITNGGGTYFQGEVTLKVWAWNSTSGGDGSAFRMGPNVKIFGAIGNQATPAATITWNTQPANGQVGDPDFAYDVTCSDGSTVTVTSANTTYATIVGGKLHYAAAGTTHLVATATDACGNVVVQNSSNFTVSAAAPTYSVTHSLTNVTATSGATGAGAATEGVAYNAVFAANTGYVLPSTITVIIDGSPATVGTGYTWNASTGAFQVPAAQVTGAIVITIAGETAPATKDIYYGAITITAGALTKGSTGTSQFFTNIGGTIENNTEISWSSGPSTASQYYNSNNLTDTELSKSSNWGTSSTSNRYIQGFKFQSGSTYTLALGSKVASSITFYGRNGSESRTMTIGGEEWTSSATKNTHAKHEFTKSGGFTGNVSITENGDFYGILVITIQTATPCTTPVIPTLSNQTVCPGSDIAAWNATQTAVLADGETASYSWKKKGNDTELANTATFDLGSSAAESQAGTYVVTVTVSKAGKASATATKEVTLTVTAAVEEPVITANKATVYPGNSVTLTATCGTDGVTWNWYLCANADGTGAGSSLGTSSSYTIASAGAAGTYYYKAVATGSCGIAERVYTLTVTAASECEKYFWFVYAADATSNGVINNRDGFFTGAPTGSSNSSTYKFTLDGTEYTATKNTGSGSFSISFTIPEGSTATMGINCKGSSSKPLYLTHSSGTPQKLVSNSSSNASCTVEDITEGTWTLTSAGSWTLAALGVQVCTTSTCTDATPTITAANTTVCVGSELSISSTGYETGATFQWQKLNSSTSTWDNISGATSATYTVATAAAEHAGSYRLVATKGCARTSNTVTISVPSVPNFGSTVPASVSVMQTIALSINTVEATDAVKYRWYKSADATWDAGDTEIGTNKELIKAYDSEATGSPSYYIFCRAQNACGITTSTAIAVTVTAYVEEDCATRGNESDAEFGFQNSGCGQGTYNSASCWTMNSNSKILIYSAPDGKYFKTMKVTIASSSASQASYNWSTDGGTTYTSNGVAITGVTTTLTEKTINLSAHGNVNEVKIGRNFGNGESSGTLYVSKICFEYTDACTATTVTPDESSKTYEMGSGSFTESTFTVKHGGTAFDPQPTLTYSSSNEDIASVDDDGTVTFNGEAGTVTITASYAGDGTYCASEGSYTITVSCSGGAPKVVADGSVDMSGCNSSVTLNAKTQVGADFADGTYQWFRNGEEIDGATSSSYTATQAGTYTVERTNTSGCTTPSTNSAIITSETTEPEVERLVPFQYYHVDKEDYSDQMKMRHLFAVKNSGKLDGKSFKMYVSRNGGAATDVTSSNALEVWQNEDGHVDTVMVNLNKLSGKYSENDELVFTCKAIDCSKNISDVYKNTITMRVIGATPTLALICSGSNKAGGTRKTGELTVGGDFLTGYNVADLCQQTGNTSFDANTEWGLYTRLKENYIVTPVNGYAVFNKLNYEPFDILLLTDYPKASKSDAAATVLDDMADLCDYRPMLSFKAHMVAKQPSKWAAKGFTTSPVVPKNTRTRLNIVCYAHPMFSTLKSTATHIQKDNDDPSQIVYTMLTGAGYEGSKGLQGFELEAAENFVTIGLVHYNATPADGTPSAGLVTWDPGTEDRMLVTAVERQENLEARMIMFAVNCGAQSKFTETGRNVVLKCLEYLLDDDPLHVADCSFTFDNGAGNSMDAAAQEEACPSCTGTKGDGKWSTAANWGPDYVVRPGKDTEVKIAAPVTVDPAVGDGAATNFTPKVRSVRILEGGKVEIPAGSYLEVVSTIRRQDGNDIYPTEVEDLHIGSGASGNGTLIFNNTSGDTKAQVDMYSTAKADMENMSAATSTWQYIGTPYSDVASATHNYYDSWLYQYSGSGWEVIPNGGPLVPFRGYCVTHPAAPVVFSMEGTLAATTSQDIAIPAGYTVIANSWVAPIDINAITDDDMEGITDKTIYFFNTGTDAGGTAGTGTAAGTYRATPIHSSSYTGDWQIPSMQGFYVSTTTAGTFHLDYERHVRPAGSRTTVDNPMYAPRRAAAESDDPNVLKIFARGSRYQDKLVVLEREDFTRGYDSGWDGEAWGGSNLSPMVYVTGEGREDAVSAIPEFEGTVVAFKAGEDKEYRFEFIYDGDESLYLFDTENNTYTQIMTGESYYFSTDDKAPHSRFILTRKAPQIATGVEPTSDGEGAKARKLLIEDKMYILLNGMLYDATGKVVK